MQKAKQEIQSFKIRVSALLDMSDRNIGRTWVEVPLFSDEPPKYGLNWTILDQGWRKHGIFKRVHLQILAIIAMARHTGVSDLAGGHSVPSLGKRKRECSRARDDFRR